MSGGTSRLPLGIIMTETALAHPPPKRRPTPGERVCIVCGYAGVYASGFQPGAPEWCREHVPAGFVPGSKVEAA